MQLCSHIYSNAKIICVQYSEPPKCYNCIAAKLNRFIVFKFHVPINCFVELSSFQTHRQIYADECSIAADINHNYNKVH